MTQYEKDALDEYQKAEARHNRLYAEKRISIGEILALHRHNAQIFANRIFIGHQNQ